MTTLASDANTLREKQRPTRYDIGAGTYGYKPGDRKLRAKVCIGVDMAPSVGWVWGDREFFGRDSRLARRRE
jgi:hypothetical protein